MRADRAPDSTTYALPSGELQSMGRVGSCFDNAVSEAFNSVLKVEYVHPPPPQLAQQRVEASATAAIPCLTSGIRTRGSERERPLNDVGIAFRAIPDVRPLELAVGAPEDDP